MKKLKMQVLKKKGWYWRLVASNGKIMCHSEQLYSKSNAIRAANNTIGDIRESLITFVEDSSTISS